MTWWQITLTVVGSVVTFILGIPVFTTLGALWERRILQDKCRSEYHHYLHESLYDYLDCQWGWWWFGSFWPITVTCALVALAVYSLGYFPVKYITKTPLAISNYLHHKEAP